MLHVNAARDARAFHPANQWNIDDQTETEESVNPQSYGGCVKNLREGEVVVVWKQEGKIYICKGTTGHLECQSERGFVMSGGPSLCPETYVPSQMPTPVPTRTIRTLRVTVHEATYREAAP